MTEFGSDNFNFTNFEIAKLCCVSILDLNWIRIFDKTGEALLPL